MSLTGKYKDAANKNYKTIEGRKFLSEVRAFLEVMDVEMKNPSSFERGQRLGALAAKLEIAADVYDLFGEKDRRKKSKRLPLV